ncbi:MAG: hypothetical protein ACOC0A_05505, partial [Planctomycetota bacterium]
ATISSQQAISGLRNTIGSKTQQIAASMRNGQQVLSLTGVDVFTIPLSVVNDFESLDPSPDEIRPQTQKLPDVHFAPDIDPDESGLSVLWNIPENFRNTVADLRDWNLDDFSASDVREFFATRGFPGLFPDWSDKQINTAKSTGKIPDYDIWSDKLASGDVGLDALMNLHAAYYFADDQKTMDDRIRSML